MTDTRQERRGARRVEARLSLRISTPDGKDAALAARFETINISTSGAYFRTDRHLEPMTKLALEIELPVPGAGGRTESELVACEGIVVRTEPEQPAPEVDEYEIAVFFTRLEASAASVLERHIAALVGPGG